MGWSYNFWKSTFYPESLSSKEFLKYYSTKFNTVEIDNTFYRIPRKQHVLEWKKHTPPDFVFSLKFPRLITHIKMLENCEEETSVFLEHVALFEEKLGPLLLQFPPSFKDVHLSILKDYLEHLNEKYKYAVEIRNKELLNPRLFSILRRDNVALVWTDSYFIPSVSEITSDFIYLRWEGDRNHVKGNLGKIEIDRKTDLAIWLDKLKPIFSKEIVIFGYFSKYYSGHPPSDVFTFLELTKSTPTLNQ